jgi:RecB family exonuclease
MFEPIIARIDAAETPFVGGALSVALLTFVRDLTHFAASGAEAYARRALCSPFSEVPNADARALCVVAGERGTLRDAIERDRVALPRESALAARRFLRALGSVTEAYRAQGATAAEHLATIRLAFDLSAAPGGDFAGGKSDAEAVTLAALEAAAAMLDAARAPGISWNAQDLVAQIDRLARCVPRDCVAPAALAAAFPRREPETPANVKRRRGHFSASSLGSYAECERRWYYRYVCAAVEDRGSSASFYGTAFHWALERFHEEFPRADAAPLELLERKLDAYLGSSFERFRSGFETQVEYELQRRRAKRTARRYLAWFVERSRREPFTVVGTETAVELELEGYSFIGYIDRLDRDDRTNAVTVVDYKTGSIAESARDYRAKVARFLDFQLPFYYWARTAAGDRVTRLSLVPLKEASLEVRPIELEVVPVAALPGYSDAAVGTIGIDELERARARMIELARTLSDATIERFGTTDDAEACTFCSYQNSCRNRPLMREDRFGR